MKTSALKVVLGITLLFTSITALDPDDYEDDDDYYGDEPVFDFEDPNEEYDYDDDDNYVALDDDSNPDVVPSDDGGLDDSLRTKTVVKRAWIYKCVEEECNSRCQKLLELPQGQCGNGGKCYCRRKAKNG